MKPTLTLRAPLLALTLVLVAASVARADQAQDLRALADTYALDGDLEKTLAALKELKATPADLLAALRAPHFPATVADAGDSKLKIDDGHGKQTDLFVVTPKADELAAHAKQGLALVVCLHGLGGNGSRAHAICAKIAATGDTIAVAPTAQVLDKSDATTDDGIPAMIKNRHWWAYDDPHAYALEAIRKARALYPIDPDRIVLSGMSMGGYGTWNIGLRHPDVFAALSPLAGGISIFPVKSMDDLVSKELLENGRNTPILSIHGDSDSIVPYAPDKEACEYLTALGGKVELVTLPGVNHDLQGVHSGYTENGEKLVKFVTSQHRESSPEAVTYVSVSERLDGAFWLRVAKRGADGKAPKIAGKVDKAKNAIAVSCENASRVRVYVDDRLLDLSKAITVTLGKARVSKKLEPTFAAILESWRSRQDEKLVYPAYVELDAGASEKRYY